MTLKASHRSKTLVIGHRGAASHALENTALSFSKAIEMGVDGIELDIRETLDHEFLVIHHDHLGRISQQPHRVDKTAAAVLKSVDLHGGLQLLSLEEAFKIIPARIGVLVEVKALRSYSKLVNRVALERRRRNLMLTSFDLTLLLKIYRMDPRLSLGVVSRSLRNIRKAQEMGVGFSSVCLDYQCLNQPLVDGLKTLDLKIFAWTVDRPQDMARMLDLEIDGIISNKPDLLKSLADQQ